MEKFENTFGDSAGPLQFGVLSLQVVFLTRQSRGWLWKTWFVCVYIYIYIYIQKKTNIYIYIHIHMHVLGNVSIVEVPTC